MSYIVESAIFVKEVICSLQKNQLCSIILMSAQRQTSGALNVKKIIKETNSKLINVR